MPPVTAASATPLRTMWNACAIAWFADAHALTVANAGPCSLCSMLIWHAGAFAIRRTIVSGCRRGLFSAYRRRDASSFVCSPPMPVPMTTAVFSPIFSCAKSMPACAMASRAATSANCETRSSRISFFSSKCFSGSKSRTSAAMPKRSASRGSDVIGPIAERPSRSAAHVAGAVWPSGVTAPMPVMTTRCMTIARIDAAEAQAGGGFAALRRRASRRYRPGPDRFGVEVRIAVGHRDLEVILDLEKDLHGVERLDLEILQRRLAA